MHCMYCAVSEAIGPGDTEVILSEGSAVEVLLQDGNKHNYNRPLPWSYNTLSSDKRFGNPYVLFMTMQI